MAGSDQDNRARAETDKVDGGPTRVRPGVSASIARRRSNARASREGWTSPVRINTNEVKWWAHQDLNLGPIDYESTALTN